MLKNKIIVKKVRNIIILLMAIVIMIGAYKNIRDAQAENVIEIEMEVADKNDILLAQTITVEARETSDGNYLLELPLSVNGNIVNKYYTPEGEEIEVQYNGEVVTLQLTEEEVTNQKVQLETNYDTKEVSYNEETKTLYNKELKYNEEVIITGYMPLDSQLEITEIDTTTLAGVTLENENQTIQKGYDISIFETVEKTIETVVDGTVNTTIETEKVEYDPSIYEEQLQVSIKNQKDSEVEQNVTVYDLDDNPKLTKIQSTLENENIIFTSNSVLDKYVVVVENVQTSVNEPSNNIMMFQTQENTLNTEMNSATTYSTEANVAATDGSATLADFSSETTVDSKFWGNTFNLTPALTRRNISTIRFVVGTDGYNTHNLGALESAGAYWNVDEGGTGAIKAYYQDWSSSNSTDGYHIWVYSDTTINANANSSYLFANLAYTKYYSRSNGESEVLYGLENLNTETAEKMNYMFYGIGSPAMTKLDLGTNFDTSNVTEMANMFGSAGYHKLKTLNLGSKFSTAKVKNMNRMFCYTAYSSPNFTSLSLGDGFYTKNVEDMQHMFNSCGYTAMTRLNLGYEFRWIPKDNMTGLIFNTGATNCIIFCPYSIYSSSQTLKESLNGSTIVATYNRGTIHCGPIIKLDDNLDFEPGLEEAVSSAEVTISVTNQNVGLVSQSFEYSLVPDSEIEYVTSDSYSFGTYSPEWVTATLGDTISIGEGLDGGYQILVKNIIDNYGIRSSSSSGAAYMTYGDLERIDGVYYHVFGMYYFDNSAPSITINPTTSSDKLQKHTLTVNVTDDIVDKENYRYAGLPATGNKVKYGWSTSLTTAPTSYTEKTLSNSSGAESSSFEVTTPSETGKYYLWVLPVTLKDTLGNTASTTTPKKSGIFYVDLTAPTPGTMTMKLGSSSGSDYTNGNWTNQSVYIAVNNGTDTLGTVNSGHKSTTYTVKKNGSAYYTNRTASATLSATGTYTITVTTTDNAGNTATNEYTVKIDKVSPTAGTMTMKLGSSSGSDYTNGNWTNQSVYVAVNNGTDTAGTVNSGHKSTTYTVKKNGSAYYTNRTASATLSATGTYTITVTTTDNAGNTRTSEEYTINIDKVLPTITIEPTSDETWRVEQTAKVTLADAHSGLAAGNQIKYGWSTSTTTAPSNYTTETLTNEEGATSTTFIAGSQHLLGKVEGTYYLWIEPVTLKDMATNAQSGTTKSSGIYSYDYKEPTITLSAESNEVWSTTHNVTVTLADGGSGLGTTQVEYGWAKLNDDGTVTEPENWQQVNSSTFTATTGSLVTESGKYQLWVKPNNLSDVAEDERGDCIYGTLYTGPNSKTEIKKSSGEFWIDIDNPIWSYDSKEIYYLNEDGSKTDIKPAGENYINAERVADITLKGIDVTSNLTKLLSDESVLDEIVIKVDGNDANVTKELIEESEFSGKEAIYKLRIRGLTDQNGILTIAMPSGSLKDEAGNTISGSTVTTDITVDTSSPDLELTVTSPTEGIDKRYKAGQEITITATYNEAIYKEKTTETLIDPKVEGPIMTLKFGGTPAKGIVTYDKENSNGNVFTYKYTITGAENLEGNDGDNGTLEISLETVYDVAGNEVSANRVSKNIVADTIIPTLIITSNKNGPTNAQKITYTFNFYENRTTGLVAEAVTGFSADDININNGTKDTFSGSGSTYTLEVLTVDNLTYDQKITVADGACVDIAGNENTGADHTITVDRTDPTVTITPNKTTNAVANDYINTPQNVTITVTDDFSGLHTNNEYKYYVLNSEESEIAEWQEYTDGQTITLNPGISGEYYIYVKPIRDNVTDDDKNISTTESYHKIGPYKFDYDSPTITVEPTSKQWTNSEVSVTVTSVDRGGAGLQSSNGEYFLSTNANPTEEATGETVSGTYTNGTPFNIKPETTGEYYLFVKQISDNLGNITNTTDYVTIDGVVYHRYGTYQFDLTAPEWTVKNVTINDDKTVTAQIEGIDNHSGCASSTLEKENITVKIDGVTANITKDLTADAELENTYILTLSDFEEESGLQSDKNYLEWSGTISIEIAEGTLTDNAGNVNNDDECTLGFADFIKPRVIYKYSESDINKTDKKFTMTFDITDKYFASSSFATELAATTTDAEKLTVLKQYLTITIDGIDITEIDEVTKKIISVSDVTAGIVGNPINKTISGVLQTGLTNQVVGKRYTLELSNLEQAGIIEGDDYLNYSGVVSVSIKEGTAIDNGPKGDGANPNGNVSGTTSTIISGVDNPSSGAGSSEQIVDLVDPIWTAQDFSVTNNVVTVKLNATDKYFDSSTLTTNDITAIKINNDDITSGVTNLSISNTVTTLEYGQQYTLTFTLPDLESEDFGGGYVEFSDGNIVGGNAKYREESINGPIKITIAGGTIVDEHENEWKENDVQLGILSATTKPEIHEVQTTSNSSEKTETIIFNVTDKYYDTTELITVGEDTDGDGTPEPDEITVYIDGEVVTGVKKEITSIVPITYTPEGETEGTIVGHQYTLVLSEFEQTTSANDLYTNHSGTVSIKIEQDAIKDPSNNGNEEKTITGDFIDFIKPEIRYQYFGTSRDETPNANPDIDYTNKTFKMEFSVTDKYMYLPTAEEILAGETNQLTLDDLEIKISSGQLDSEGNVIEYDLKSLLQTEEGVSYITFSTPEEIKATNIKMTTNKTDKTIETVTEKVIGYKYVITITNLEQLEKAIGATTLDYSGVITVAVAENKVIDDSNNGNDGKTITSGLNTPNGEGNGVVVDVVDPIWESAGTTIDFDNFTAQIKINATDTYFSNSILNTNNIELIAIKKDNTEQELTGVQISETITALTETRLVNETETTVQYGNQYTLNVTGIPEDIYKLKLQINAGQKDENGQLTSGIIDNSGNINKDITLNLINYLRIAGEETTDENGETVMQYETDNESGFLGNTTIQRQNIEKITFVDNIKGVNSTKWDVSETQDDSILAWYTEREASDGTKIYQVYIGSDGLIFANEDSSYLFANIGSSMNCIETKTIEAIELLNTVNVTNMSYMFSGTGYRSMTSLNLGNNFSTSNVTDMSYMFMACGQLEMTTLTLGANFNTSNVKDNSDTTDVIEGSMANMFKNCGQNKLTALDLGSQFITNGVTDMSSMFEGCGQLEMTTLTLGENFNTEKVTNMSSMFKNCGQTKLSSLDLGDKFYTPSATNMTNMFNGCGTTAMTNLDLGPAFTRIGTTNTDFLKDCGTTGAVIHVPESIYSDSTYLKLDTNSTTTIEYTQGTINPKYRTEWIKESTDVTVDTTNIDNSKIEITLRGQRISTTPSEEYVTDVVSELEESDIKVFIDGTQLTDVNISVGTADYTNPKEIKQVITLSNFEENGRRTGKPFKEWSGNITLDIAKGTLKDKFGSSKSGSVVTVGLPGNGNFAVSYEDAENSTANTDGNLFTDFIKPEFTYEYSETTIGSGPTGDNKVKVVFNVTDKYFKETSLATDTTANLITVKGDTNRDGLINESDETLTITKELSRTGIFVINKTTGAITTQSVDYVVPETERKVGERYELTISGLETPEESGIGYSGPISLAFNSGIIEDLSANVSDGKTITIGIDEPTNPDHNHNSGVVVDVVNPRWLGLTNKNTIDRTNNTVSIKILGIDQYYDTNTLDTSDITVYIDLDGDGTIEDTEIANIATSDITLTQIATDELTTLATEANLTDVKVGYTLTIGGFGTSPSDISGITKIKIADNTIKDQSGNINKNTDPIYVGNEEWTETGDTEGIYTGFENHIVDFIKPIITYQYSTIMVDTDDDGVADTEISENPDIDYTAKTVTVKFKVLDKYLRQSDLIGDSYVVQEDEVDVTKYEAKNINIIVDGQDVTNKVTTNITADNADITDGEIVYTLTVSNLQQSPNNAFDFSGPMQLVFAENVIDDTSGNKNSATSITIDTDDGDSNINDGIIVDVVDPIWELGTISLDEGTVELIAKDKFFKTCTLSTSDIIVYVNGNPSEVVGKDITTTPPTNIYDTVNGVENTIVGKKYTLKLSNITPTGGGYTEFTPTNQSELVVGEGFKYRTENGGHIAIQIKAATIEDTSGNKNLVKDFDIGTIDATKPEIYEVQKIQKAPGIDADANTETIIFNVTDRNYDSTDFITKEEIELFIDNVKLDALKAGATLTSKEIKANIDNTIRPVGHQYTLVIPNIAETEYQDGKSYLENSGTLEVRVKAESAKDLKGNKNEVTSIRDFIDFIKPEIQQVTVTNPKNTTDKTYTMSFKVIDKYLDTTNMVTENEIAVYIDGETVTAIAKPETASEQEANKDKLWMELSSSEINAEFNKTVSGTVDGNGKITGATITNGTYTIGHTYTLVLSNFEQAEKQTGKNFMEWSGTVKIEIAQNAVNDKNPITNTAINNSDEKTIDGEHVDFIKPVIENASSERGTNTETIYFDVIDKYLADSNTNVIGTNEIIVYIDGNAVTVDYANSSENDLDGVLTKVQDYKATVNGNTEHIVGQRYQLVLSNFEQTSRNGQGYKDWSGTVSIEITQNAVQDTSENTLDSTIANRTVTGDFVDFIKPDIKYIHQSSDINAGNNSYTMTFDITDKYYKQGELKLENLGITMQNGQLDSNGDEIVHNLKTLATQGKINIAFDGTPYYAGTASQTINVTNETTGVVEEIAANTHQIGHTYTLTISNLDQLKVEGTNTTANYSGIITVVVDADIIKDRGPSGDGTNQNTNVGKSITSGVDIPGGSGTGTVVDVVNPVFDKISSSANATSSTATITFKGTDTYFDVDESTLTTDDIQVVVDGEVVTSGITKTITATEALKEDRIINGTTQNDVQYGIKYTLQITGWAQNANQVKIRILGNEDINDNGTLDEGEDVNGNGTLDVTGPFTDESGNSNKVTELILYNCLELTSSETAETNKFLDGNGVNETVPTTGIARQDIQQVIFVDSLAGASGVDVKTVWDVSAMTDGSIKAWTEQSSAPYTVYIGSDDEIFANQNSSYLFANIGYGSNCTVTEVITGIELLNVNSVTNMSNMFKNFGYRKMITLNLGTKFNTSNVIDMSSMFEGCGQLEMTTLTLGANFNTSNVKDNSDTTDVIEGSMSNMFKNCGQNKLTALDLGSQFITNGVTDMSSMFEGCGQLEMTTLTLGANFNTAKVTNMSSMFKNCGQTKLSSLDLGSQFNTSLVVNMSSMFEGFGTTEITSLDLGDLFYTTSATNMNNMFNGCGTTAMTVLDLGPAFTKIASQNTDFMKDCGTIQLVIYAPESIYSNKTSFKLNN